MVPGRMIDNEEHARTIAYAETAMGQIKALRQPATPRNFEIWYTYATGHRPELNQAINETLVRDGRLTDQALAAIAFSRPRDSASASTRSAHASWTRLNRSCR